MTLRQLLEALGALPETCLDQIVVTKDGNVICDVRYAELQQRSYDDSPPTLAVLWNQNDWAMEREASQD